MSNSEQWRERLREAVENSPKKHSVIAREAGLAPATLSRLLSGEHLRPSFASVIRVARVCGVSVGWLLDEPARGLHLSNTERLSLHAAGALLLEVLERKARA